MFLLLAKDGCVWKEGDWLGQSGADVKCESIAVNDEWEVDWKSSELHNGTVFMVFEFKQVW